MRLSGGRPRVGFLGVGWIGRHRMEAMAATGAIEAAAFVDPSDDAAAAASRIAPEAVRTASLDALLALDLDAVVIATPSAAHAGEAIRALTRGVAVFCQKPLGRTEEEVRAVVAAAGASDRLLGVDLSYRHAEGARRIRSLIGEGALGRIFAVDLVFHNAYGPDKPWFYDPALSGGGCVMDLGVHLIDLALWSLGPDAVEHVDAHLFAGGAPVVEPLGRTEDYATATLTLASGAVVRLACSWRLHAGQDAVISASFFGDRGGAELRNVGGSFYDFTAERFDGTARTTLATPPDAWNVGAAQAFARALAKGGRFDPEVESVTAVAAAIDRIYGRRPAAREGLRKAS